MEEESILFFPLFKMTVSLLLLVICLPPSLTFSPYDLRLDYYSVTTTDDLILYSAEPRFAWKLPSMVKEQHAYQIEIRSEWNRRWNSGWIVSTDMRHLFSSEETYFQPWTVYRFRLRVRTDNETSRWTPWIRFRTVTFQLHQYLMDMADRAFWIGSNEIGMNELRREFQLDSAGNVAIRSAIVVMSGLGYYELSINGRAVDPTRKLDPGWTTYERRTLFVTFDVTSFVQVRCIYRFRSNSSSPVLARDECRWGETWKWMVQPGAIPSLTTERCQLRYRFVLDSAREEKFSHRRSTTSILHSECDVHRWPKRSDLQRSKLVRSTRFDHPRQRIQRRNLRCTLGSASLE